MVCDRYSYLKQIVDCDKWTIIIIDQQLMDLNPVAFAQQRLQRIFHHRRWYNVLSATEDTYSEPQFTSLSELKGGRKR